MRYRIVRMLARMLGLVAHKRIAIRKNGDLTILNTDANIGEIEAMVQALKTHKIYRHATVLMVVVAEEGRAGRR